MGGEMTYTYVGFTGGQYHYNVVVKVYRCCTGGVITDCSGANFRSELHLGVYEHDPSNPNADKNMVGSEYILTLGPVETVEPLPPGDTCTFPLPYVCMEQATYEVEIALPASTGGFHLEIEDCCRNESIINIVDTDPQVSTTDGMTWYAFIPPTSIQNNSAQFVDAIPVPFICTGDTFDYSNIATDADGDVLRYALVHPFGANRGESSIGTPPVDPLNWPLDTVEWQWGTGHNLTNILGPNGYASINTNTGITQYYLPTWGPPVASNDTARFYVASVQVSEYRGVTLVGRIRRDLQLVFVMNCPVNAPPNLAPNPDTGRVVRNYTIMEGDSVCFPVTYNDPDGKKLYLSGLNLPSGAQFQPDSAFGTVSSDFCWNTNCNDTGTFYFVAKVIDNACPSIVIYETDTINVISFTGKPISGPDTSCANQPVDVYSIAGSAGSTYSWTVNGGTIASGQGTNTISVNWGSTSGNFSVSAIETSADGCPAAQETKNVFLKPSAVVNAGTDLTFCSGASGVFNGDSISGYTYLWSPGSGLSNTTIANPSVTLTNSGTTIVTNTIYKTGTFNGCTKIDTVLVLVKPLPVSNAGNDIAFCSGDTGQLGTSATAGYSYSWTATTGLDNPSISNPEITLLNGTTSPQNFTYTVTSTLDGCVTSDDVIVTVNPLPTLVPVANPNPICYSDITNISVSGASVYFWTISGFPLDTISQLNNFNDTLFANTTYIVGGTDVNGCKNTNSLNVIVNPLPIVQATATPDSICIGDVTTLNGTGANSYDWYFYNPNVFIDTGSSIIVSSDTIAATDSFLVIGTDTNGCVNVDTLQVVTRPKPITKPIFGPDFACPNVQGLDYSVVDSLGGSTFVWTITLGTITSGQGTNNIKVDWGGSGTGTLSVLETNKFGCEADTPVTMSILIDTILNPQAPWGDDYVCLKERDSLPYQTFFIPGSTYAWGIIPDLDTILSNTGNQIVVTWDSVFNQNPILMWFDIVTTTITNVCFGRSDTLEVYLYPSPNTSAVAGNISVCAYDLGSAYSVTGGDSSVFNWRVDTNTNISITANGNDSVSINWDSAGTYTVQITETNQFGCDGVPKNLSVTVHPLPSAIAIVGDDIVCSSDTSLAYSTDGINSSTFNWTTSSGTIISGTGTENITLQLGGTGTDTIRVMEQTQFLCFGPLAQKIITLDNQQVDMNVVTDDYATDSKIEIRWDLLNGQYFQGTYYLYRKTKEDAGWQLLTTLTEDSFTDVNVATKNFIYQYLVQAVNLCGDTVGTLYHNKMLLLPNASQGERKFSILWNRYINWSSGVREYEVWRKSDDEPNYTLWRSTPDSTMDFDDGKNAFKHYFRIRAIENVGNFESWSNELVINFDHKIIIPSAFTPNGDGVNDKWEIQNIDIYPLATVQIFNRWGAKVYLSQSYNNDWDGTFKGKDLTDGTYYYVVDIHDEKTKPFTGPVSIIR